MCKSANALTDKELTDIGEIGKAEYVLDTPNSDRARQQAKEEGLIVVTPKPNELQIDIDSEADFGFFLQQLATYRKEVDNKVTFKSGLSKGGYPRRHITMFMSHKITNTERILLQTLFGSDRTRELLSWIQELNGDANPTLFLEKPEVVK